MVVRTACRLVHFNGTDKFADSGGAPAHAGNRRIELKDSTEREGGCRRVAPRLYTAPHSYGNDERIEYTAVTRNEEQYTHVTSMPRLPVGRGFFVHAFHVIRIPGKSEQKRGETVDVRERVYADVL